MKRFLSLIIGIFILFSTTACSLFQTDDSLGEITMKNFIVFGDSYSTFQGYIPDGYATYYATTPNAGTNVCHVKQTWWHQLKTKTGAKLVQNNSWSGSTIGYTGYNGTDASTTSSFIYRFEKLVQDGFFNENPVDTVLVFGGTNDSWADAPIGELKYSDWEKSDLYYVLPAICYFLNALKTQLPNAKIVVIVNTELKKVVENGLLTIAEHYGATGVLLHDIDKTNGHPTHKGMTQICEQILAVL